MRILTVLIIFTLFSKSLNAQEDYHLVADQSFYFPGEEVRFSVLTSIKSKDEIVTLSLFKDDRILYSNNFLIEDGVGSDVVKLPEDLSPGNYRIFLHSGTVSIGSSSIVLIDQKNSSETVPNTNISSDEKFINVRGLSDSIYTNQEIDLELLLRRYRLEEAIVNVTITNRRPAVIEEFKGIVFDDPFASRRFIQVEGVLRNENGEPIGDRPFNVLIPSTQFSATGRTDSNGNFKIRLRSEESEFYCIFSSVLGADFGIHEIDLKELSYASDITATDTITMDISRYVENNIINDAFSPYRGSITQAVKSQSDPYLELCNHVVDPDEFIAFRKVGEMLHEILPRVRVKDDRVRIVPDESPRPLKKPVLFLVDGVPTYNKEFILSLDQGSIKSIGVISSLSSIKPFRQAGEGGIIVFDMDENFDPETVQMSGNIIGVQGLDGKPVESFTIDKETISFSSLLYWNERIELSSEESKRIRFRTSYESGTYYIHLRGISDKGVFSEVREFTVHQSVQ